jgi:hypothetical protein
MINYKVTYLVHLFLEKLMAGKGIQFFSTVLSFTLYSCIVLQVKDLIIFRETE